MQILLQLTAQSAIKHFPSSVRRLWLCCLSSGLISGCVDFPEFPTYRIIDMSQDSMMVETDASTDQAIEADMADMEIMMIDEGVDQSMQIDMDMEIDQEIEIDLDPMPDLGPPLPSFDLVTCNENRQLVFEGASPLECPNEGEEWVRVSGVTDRPYSREHTEVGLEAGYANVTLQYVYYIMKREVSYLAYASRCTDTLRPDSLDERRTNATCLAPSVNSACAAALQSQLNEAIDNQTVNVMTGEETDLPMNCVGWEDAANYCRRIGGRLPTEVEWEMAATTGSTHGPASWPIDAFPALNAQQICEYINFSGGEICTNSNPLDAKIRPSCWGAQNPWLDKTLLCDMSGNVAEWVLDDPLTQVASQLDGSPSLDTTDLTTHLYHCASTEEKIVRGGSGNQGYLPSQYDQVYWTNREVDGCQAAIEYKGFRCVISEETHGIDPPTP